MSFLRRLLGAESVEPSPDPAAAADDELERERELLRSDPAQTRDELIARQLRYADRSWTPPAQGGSRRADDADAPDA